MTKLLSVAVKPGSKNPGVTVDGDILVLRVRERAIEGAANEACIRALAQHFNVPVSQIELVRGARSKQKVFRIVGVSQV